MIKKALLALGLISLLGVSGSQAANPSGVVTVANFTQLQALGNASPQYPYIHVAANNAGAVSGGGDFTYKSTCPITPDSGVAFSVTVTGSPSACYARVTEGQSVSVDWYGADPSGVSTSTTAIQSAFNVISGKRLIFSPNGTYKISGTYVYLAGGSTNFSIDCQNAIIVQNTSNTPIFVLKGPSNTIQGDIGYCVFAYGSAQTNTNTNSIAISLGSPTGEGGLWTTMNIHDIRTTGTSFNDVYNVVAYNVNTGVVNATFDRSVIQRIHSNSIGSVVKLATTGGTLGGISGLVVDQVYSFSTSSTNQPLIETYACHDCTYSNIDRTGFTNTTAINQPLVQIRSGVNNYLYHLKTENERYTGTGFNLINIDSSYNTVVNGFETTSDILNMTAGSNYVCIAGDTSVAIANTNISLSGYIPYSNTYTQGYVNILCPGTTHLGTLSPPSTVDTVTQDAPNAQLLTLTYSNEQTFNFTCTAAPADANVVCGTANSLGNKGRLVSLTVTVSALPSAGQTLTVYPVKNGTALGGGFAITFTDSGPLTQTIYTYYYNSPLTAATNSYVKGDTLQIKESSTSTGSLTVYAAVRIANVVGN